MPKKEFAIHADGPLRLEVEWKGVWKNLTIRFDGERVGSIADIKQLRKDDNVFPLPDGSSVQVRLGRGLFGAELEVTRDGDVIPLLSPGGSGVSGIWAVHHAAAP